MATRFNPTTVSSTYAATAALNTNFSNIATLLDLAVMRDGRADNGMLADLDMNHFKLVNVGAPINPTDVARLQDITNLLIGGNANMGLLASVSGAGLIGAADGTTVQAHITSLEGKLGTRDYGTIQSGSTNANDISVTFNGAPDGTSQVYSFVNRLYVNGSANVDYARENYGGVQINTTGGTINVASGKHEFVWLNTTGNVTFANIYEGHLRIDQGALTNQANYYNCASISFITGSANIVTGYNTNQIGDATRVQTVYAFNAQDTSAATLSVSFRSELVADPTKYAFLANGGAQSAFLGKVKFGQVAAAAEAVDVHGNILCDGNIRINNAAGRIGYQAGAGSTVSQITSRTTAVTINKPCGEIDLVSAAGTATWQTFTVNNSVVGANDVIRVVQKSGTDKYMIHVTRVAVGAFDITFATTGGTTTESPAFNFVVISGANS